MVKAHKIFEDSAKTLLKELSGRTRDVVERRFGIGARSKRQTLESIGDAYKITRERVRQIENAALGKIRSSQGFRDSAHVFEALEKEFNAREGLWREEEALRHFAGEDPAGRNYVYFFLSLGEPFERLSADYDFYHRWTNKADTSRDIEKTLKSFCLSLGDEPLKKDDIYSKFRQHAESAMSKTLAQEAVFSWLGVSRNIVCNSFGEWGLSVSPLVRPSGMRDFAYLVLKRHGSPLHFREVASSIEKISSKRAHVQTVHNELIKDDRFVLVGRGLYALTGWGYRTGTVKDIIKEILSKNGPAHKNELIKLVKQERYVKDNTILINLQNRNNFKKLPDGRFHLA